MNHPAANAFVYGPVSIVRAPNTAASDHVHNVSHEAHVAPRAVVSDRQRTLVVVDAACDMPSVWLAENNIVVLPIKLTIDDWELYDTHNEFDFVWAHSDSSACVFVFSQHVSRLCDGCECDAWCHYSSRRLRSEPN